MTKTIRAELHKLMILCYFDLLTCAAGGWCIAKTRADHYIYVTALAH